MKMENEIKTKCRAEPICPALYGYIKNPSVGADDPVAVPKISALPYGGHLKF